MQSLAEENPGTRIFLVVLLLFTVICTGQPAVANEDLIAAQNEQQSTELVLVAGATGGTGGEVVRELLANGYRVRAFVRDADKAHASLGDDIEYAVGDVRERASIDAALDGVDALISAIGAGRGDPGNGPEFVDYGGVKNMAEAAAAVELRQFVLVSSMGVTHEDHVLNKMFNNVLIWKFKGEEALRASGVPYTIARPGGLVNEPGGQKSVVFAQGDDQTGTIPRADVARVCVAALGSADALNKTFEINSGKSAPEQSFSDAFAALDAD
ncbi:MAG: SDR family oxidoreductase [Gammaproteobacteria bacterium]|nr:SDR family oxidoreductase [Gammaproteobacteria bacterium]